MIGTMTRLQSVEVMEVMEVHDIWASLCVFDEGSDSFSTWAAAPGLEIRGSGDETLCGSLFFSIGAGAKEVEMETDTPIRFVGFS